MSAAAPGRDEIRDAADRCAAEIARKHIEWVGDGMRIDGPAYRHIHRVAIAIIEDALGKQYDQFDAWLAGLHDPSIEGR